MRHIRISVVMVPCIAAYAIAQTITSSSAQQSADRSGQPAWVARSNENAQLLLRVRAKYSPEDAGRNGVAGLEEAVTQLPPDRRVRLKADTEDALAQLRRRLDDEKDPLVRQDLQLLIKAAEESLAGQELDEKYSTPYINVAQLVFGGIRALLDDQIPAVRRKAALVRLRRYAGVESGFEPMTTQARARTREWSKPGQQGPPKVLVETDLARANFFLDGLAELFARYKIDSYQEPLARLKSQVTEYNAWVKEDILPKARADYRLPPEQYAFALRRVGVDVPAETLAAQAHRAFDEWQQEMQQDARQIAQAKGLPSADYRDVVRALKQDRLVGDAILPRYQQHLADIEAIIRRERLVTLPARPARIRLATPAETAEQPAPHMVPPPLLNNTGEQGEFVLPLNVPTQPGSSATAQVDDFTFDAVAWTLIAHEARPGHELQFDSMVERGVSLARSLFAFNSVNAEGWGLYAEHITKPYEPLEGQLIALQFRLLRAARAFIDPELQSGKLTPADGMRILTKDVVLSEAFANTEIERYTFRMPGQATSYFYGYMKLVDLRKEVEAQMGARFDQQAYHDFILAQGLLSPDLLRTAVMEGYVGRANTRDQR